MILKYTEQFYLSLEETLEFYDIQGVSREKQEEIVNAILAKTNLLVDNPHIGVVEEYLEHLNLGHRRIIEGYCKVIYRLSENYIYVTEVFDTRKDPNKMIG
jgi:plasmid stabilization system protein ParE